MAAWDWDRAWTFLRSVTDYERMASFRYGARALNLDRTRRLLAAVGDPQERIPAVHVAGSKGKGSTCIMTAAGLRAAGLRTGLYTSPHLERVFERVRVDGSEVDAETLAAAVESLAPEASAMGEGDASGAPTFFELLTAAAWVVFDRAGCDVVVLETGLGGRWDSTTVCRPVVTAITGIGLEHTQILGDTLDAIAREKAGILKDGVPCVTAPLAPEAAAAISEEAAERGAPLLPVAPADATEGAPADAPTGQPVARWSAGRIEAAGGVVRRPVTVTFTDGRTVDAHLASPGVRQAGNFAVASVLLDRACQALGAPHPEAAPAAAAAAPLPGRFEVVAEPVAGPVAGGSGRTLPPVVLDGAHTDDSAAALAATLAEWLPLAAPGVPQPARPALVVALQRDKDPRAVFTPLLGTDAPVSFTRVVAVRVDDDRGMPAGDLAEALGALTEETPVTSAPDVPAALHAAAAAADDGARPSAVVTAGSTYLAGAVRTTIAGS